MENLGKSLRSLRDNAPLVHNITNYVVMNFTANALLAVGASPVMAHAAEEVEDMVSIAGAVVINIGTLSPQWVKGMELAMKKASQLGKPVVLDPVGAGATPYRNQTLARLLTEAPPSLIRGNASEIMALAGLNVQTKGVDSTTSSLGGIEAARLLNQRYGSVVSISGETDVIVDETRIFYLKNGHPTMSRVTGMGCSASAIAGAFCAIEPSLFEAAVSAAAVMGVCGDLAAEKSIAPGSFQIAFLDALAEITPEQLSSRARISSESLQNSL
jgi:hydroxyethylthiazole kinase